MGKSLRGKELGKGIRQRAENKFYYDLFVVAIETGMRVGELSGLRDIPLTKKAITALRQQYFNKQTIINKGKEHLEGFEDLVFVTKNNRPTTQFLISECINCTIKRIHKNNPSLAFEKFTPHCFRHTFATRYLEAGVPLKTVSALLGHTQLQLTTDLYMHVTQEALFEGVTQYENETKMG